MIKHKKVVKPKPLYTADTFTKSRPRPTDKSDAEWTSYEYFNVMVKVLVDELIALGARPQLKKVALELWAKYLSTCEIAFTSKTKEALPKLGLYQSEKDYAILEGYIERKKRRLKRLQKDKAHNHKHHEKLDLSSNSSLDEDEDEDTDRTSTEALSEYRINLTDLAEVGKKIAKSSGVHCKQLKDLKSLGFLSPTDLGKQNVLAILCLSLFLTKDDIQLSDVIRWIHENHFSFLNRYKLFPEESNWTFGDTDFMISSRRVGVYHAILSHVFQVSKVMGVKEFPAPNLGALARRYVLELQLPSEMGDYVERLMATCKVDQCKELMNYEFAVMSFIIVVLKTLFGLDDTTEHCVSEFATEINRLTDNGEESRLGSRLFVWDDWVRYIEYRKSVIITKHFPSKYRTEQDLSTDVGPYALFCTTEEKQVRHITGKLCCLEECGPQKMNMINSMKSAPMDIPTLKKMNKAHKFPPSLTPQVSYLKQLLARHTVPQGDILTYDHTSTSMEFLIEPDKVKEFASSQGVEVIVKQYPPYQHQHLEYVPKARSEILPFNESRKNVYIDFQDNTVFKYDQSLEVVSGKFYSRKKSVYEPNDYSELLKKKTKRRRAKNVSTSCLNDSYKMSSEHNPLTLHLPFSAYWAYEMNESLPELVYDKFIEYDFPESFRWLLRECSRVLGSHSFAMYRALRRIEKLCAGEINTADLKLVEYIYKRVDAGDNLPQGSKINLFLVKGY